MKIKLNIAWIQDTNSFNKTFPQLKQSGTNFVFENSSICGVPHPIFFKEDLGVIGIYLSWVFGYF